MAVESLDGVELHLNILPTRSAESGDHGSSSLYIAHPSITPRTAYLEVRTVTRIPIAAKELRTGRRSRSGRRVSLQLGGDISMKVPPRFAPGHESLRIEIEWKNLSDEEVRFRIESDAYENKQVFAQPITLPASNSGKLTFHWDGVSNQPGPLEGRFVGPAHSPYRAVAEVVGGKKGTAFTEVEIAKVEFVNPDDRDLIVNNPKVSVPIDVCVFLLAANGSERRCEAHTEVRFTFIDPGQNNGTKIAAFEYEPGASLGKRGDVGAIHWEAEPGKTATSIDDFRTQCDVVAETSGQQIGVARARFQPSGVGGDNFVIEARVLASDGVMVLGQAKSGTLTVVRKIRLEAYEMQGHTHVSTHGSTSEMAKVYTPATFVKYELASVHAISTQLSVRYIGLWDHATQSQRPWPAAAAKLPQEIPRPEIVKSLNDPPGSAVHLAARMIIEKQAQDWVNRLVEESDKAMLQWIDDSGIPENSMVAFEFEHPKRSVNVPAEEARTSEWTDFPWIKVSNAGIKVHPDESWARTPGFTAKRRTFIQSQILEVETKVTIAHEAAHFSKNQFKRELFGPGDHNVDNGLMHHNAKVPVFSTREIEILRGFR